MNSRDVEKFIRKHLLPAFPGWQAKGARMFMIPIGDLVRKITFQCTSSVYISATVYPLYVPADDVGGVLFGDRIGSEDTLEPGLNNSRVKRIVKLIKTKGLPMIARYDSPAKIVASTDLRGAGAHVKEAVAYSYVLLDKPARAEPPLDAAIELLREYVTRPIHGDWGEVMLARLERFRVVLLRDPAAAKAQLARNAAEMAERTGLARYR